MRKIFGIMLTLSIFGCDMSDNQLSRNPVLLYVDTELAREKCGAYTSCYQNSMIWMREYPSLPKTAENSPHIIMVPPNMVWGGSSRESRGTRIMCGRALSNYNNLAVEDNALEVLCRTTHAAIVARDMSREK